MRSADSLTGRPVARATTRLIHFALTVFCAHQRRPPVVGRNSLYGEEALERGANRIKRYGTGADAKTVPKRTAPFRPNRGTSRIAQICLFCNTNTVHRKEREENADFEDGDDVGCLPRGDAGDRGDGAQRGSL